jgi:hypothetical protein
MLNFDITNTTENINKNNLINKLDRTKINQFLAKILINDKETIL